MKTAFIKTKIILPVVLSCLAITAIAAVIKHHIKPTFHFQRALGFQMLDDGNILVTDGGGFMLRDAGSKVFIINRKGKILRLYDDVRFAHSASRLSGGNILIPDTNRNRLVEISPGGAEIWSSDSWGNGSGRLADGSRLDYPNYASELSNGHFILSGRYNNKVWEVDRQGRIYWSYGKLKLQHAPVRLAGGGTLIADSEGNRIIEVDKSGRTVWQHSTGLNWPRYAQRLKNGNTLITDSNNDRIVEVSPSGETVFEYGSGLLSMPYQAEELPGGNIMIADGQHGRLLEINRKKQVVWSFGGRRPVYLWFTLPWNVRNGGAEEHTKDGNPAGWVKCDMLAPGLGEWKTDPDLKNSGSVSFSIESSKGPGKNKMWGQFLRNFGKCKIEARCMIRTKDVKEGAGISLNFADAGAGMLGGVNSRIIKGDTEWTELIVIAAVPEDTKVIAVLLSLVGPGKAWWDDVRIRRM